MIFPSVATFVTCTHVESTIWKSQVKVKNLDPLALESTQSKFKFSECLDLKPQQFSNIERRTHSTPFQFTNNKKLIENKNFHHENRE